jgi:hypothetical protein
MPKINVSRFLMFALASHAACGESSSTNVDAAITKADAAVDAPALPCGDTLPPILEYKSDNGSRRALAQTTVSTFNRNIGLLRIERTAGTAGEVRKIIFALIGEDGKLLDDKELFGGTGFIDNLNLVATSSGFVALFNSAQGDFGTPGFDGSVSGAAIRIDNQGRATVGPTQLVQAHALAVSAASNQLGLRIAYADLSAGNKYPLRFAEIDTTSEDGLIAHNSVELLPDLFAAPRYGAFKLLASTNTFSMVLRTDGENKVAIQRIDQTGGRVVTTDVIARTPQIATLGDDTIGILSTEATGTMLNLRLVIVGLDGTVRSTKMIATGDTRSFTIANLVVSDDRFMVSFSNESSTNKQAIDLTWAVFDKAGTVTRAPSIFATVPVYKMGSTSSGYTSGAAFAIGTDLHQLVPSRTQEPSDGGFSGTFRVDHVVGCK